RLDYQPGCQKLVRPLRLPYTDHLTTGHTVHESAITIYGDKAKDIAQQGNDFQDQYDMFAAFQETLKQVGTGQDYKPLPDHRALQEQLSNTNTTLDAVGAGLGTHTEIQDLVVKSTSKAKNITLLQEARVLGITGTKMLGAAKVLGNAGAVIGIGVTVSRAAIYYNDGGKDSTVAIKALADVTMAAVGFMGPVGFVLSTTYFLVDAGGGFGTYGQIK
ncbi:hypothetical protein, partial [Hymenobacter algoricola]|uniref:hypothetical protein n=1 Tax=Hymenobacter algoricola TaxID=486267 RepID=UPI0031EF19F6